MTNIQLDFVNKLELALANMVYDGHTKWAKALAPVIEWFHKDEPVMAILEGEALGLNENTLDSFRKVFNVKKWA